MVTNPPPQTPHLARPDSRWRGRRRSHGSFATPLTVTTLPSVGQAMRKRIDDGGFQTPCRLRKQVVEPVFGQIKQARGFRQFQVRGVEKVRAE